MKKDIITRKLQKGIMRKNIPAMKIFLGVTKIKMICYC